MVHLESTIHHIVHCSTWRRRKVPWRFGKHIFWWCGICVSFFSCVQKCSALSHAGCDAVLHTCDCDHSSTLGKDQCPLLIRCGRRRPPSPRCTHCAEPSTAEDEIEVVREDGIKVSEGPAVWNNAPCSPAFLAVKYYCLCSSQDLVLL